MPWNLREELSILVIFTENLFFSEWGCGRICKKTSEEFSLSRADLKFKMSPILIQQKGKK